MMYQHMRMIQEKWKIKNKTKQNKEKMVLLFKRQEETNYTEVCKTKTIKCNSVAGVENKSTTKNKMCTKHVG